MLTRDITCPQITHKQAIRIKPSCVDASFTIHKAVSTRLKFLKDQEDLKLLTPPSYTSKGVIHNKHWSCNCEKEHTNRKWPNWDYSVDWQSINFNSKSTNCPNEITCRNPCMPRHQTHAYYHVLIICFFMKYLICQFNLIIIQYMYLVC